MFVTFEGPEGAGKSTVIRALSQELSENGHKVLVTREPGGSVIGSHVRKLLLEGHSLLGRTELFLFLADRAQHVEDVIRPAASRGDIVLCDRYADSTVVYQGYGRGLDISLLKQLNDFATVSFKPDVTLLLDLEPEVGLARITEKDRLDSEPLEFHTRVRNGFLSEAKIDPTRWVLVNASESPESVINQCLKAIQSRL